MVEGHLERSRLHADYEHRFQVHRQVLDSLEAIGQGAKPAKGASYFGVLAMLSEPLCYVAWRPRFRPATPAHFDVSSDPAKFLQLYATAIRATRGGGCIMANWFLMATKGEAREWLLGLSLGSITSWRDLCECFIDKFAPLGQAPEAP
jgi:hypothetical protein